MSTDLIIAKRPGRVHSHEPITSHKHSVTTSPMPQYSSDQLHQILQRECNQYRSQQRSSQPQQWAPRSRSYLHYRRRCDRESPQRHRPAVSFVMQRQLHTHLVKRRWFDMPLGLGTVPGSAVIVWMGLVHRILRICELMFN
jgi:hypothetical protein